MKLRYTQKAIAELDGILADIEARSPQGALRVQARIQAITKLLLQFPKSGQLTAIPALRRLVATPYPYLIFYQHEIDEIVVVSVRHAARRRSGP